MTSDLKTHAATPSACIIRCRVSSSRQAQEGESLEVQEKICRSIAVSRNWTLAHEPWLEGASGRKARPVSEEILDFLDKHPGQVRYCLFRSIDRFSRGGSFVYEQMKRDLAARGVELIDSYGVIQPAKNTLEDLGFEYDWSRFSPSAIAELVIAAAANQEVTTILTRLIGQEIRLAQQGYKVRGPQDGFVNKEVVVNEKPRTIQIPDPERAKFLIAMYDLRAAGQLSDPEICERINVMGYLTKSFKRWDKSHQRVIGYSRGNPLQPKRLQQIIQRPEYCGIVCEKWTKGKPVRAPYPGLVSVALFNAANRGKVFIQEHVDGKLELLHDYSSERVTRRLSKNNPLFPYRHVVMCPKCRKPLMGSSPRGQSGARFPTYHCTRGHKYTGIPKATLETALSTFIGRLRYTDAAAAALRGVVRVKYQDRKEEVQKATASISNNIAELELQKAEAVRAFKLATTDMMRQAFEADAIDLDRKIRTSSESTEQLTISEDDIDEYLEDARKVIEHPHILLKNPGSSPEQQALYSLVFEELPTYEEIRDRTAKLRWAYWLFSDLDDAKSTLVRLRELSWNQVEETILHWKSVMALSPSLAATLRGGQSTHPSD